MVADVTVVGRGIIALSAALELADRGLAVRLVGTTHSGNASAAAGGMLAPSIDSETGSAHDFAIASRDYYPGYAAALAERTGRQIPTNDAGTIEVAFDELEARALHDSNDRSARWVTPEELTSAEPALAPCLGGLLHPADGAVEPLALLDALGIAIAAHEGITTVREDCRELHASELGCSVLTDMESRFSSDYVVLAAGAWTPLIAGSGDCVAAVQPVRGQMLAFESQRGSPCDLRCRRISDSTERRDYRRGRHHGARWFRGRNDCRRNRIDPLARGGALPCACPSADSFQLGGASPDHPGLVADHRRRPREAARDLRMRSFAQRNPARTTHRAGRRRSGDGRGTTLRPESISARAALG